MASKKILKNLKEEATQNVQPQLIYDFKLSENEYALRSQSTCDRT